jgi:hypothetical protein
MPLNCFGTVLELFTQNWARRARRARLWISFFSKRDKIFNNLLKKRGQFFIFKS